MRSSTPSAVSTTSFNEDSENAQADGSTGPDLAGKLHRFERLLDAAFAASGELATAAVRARAAHKVAPVAVHSIMLSISQSSAALIDARGHVVKSHKLLERLARSLEVPHAYGDDVKDPGDHKVG